MSGQNQNPDEMEEFRTQLNEIHSAVVGNPKLGHKGLVRRMDDAEGKIDAHDRRFLVYSSGAIVASTMIGFVLKLLKIL